ncbi:NADH dehydrogenase [ubiquinone] 1 alpha subcomplex subunit 7 [Dendroctonus ponderosae]
MPPKPNVKVHDVNPFLQHFRQFLLGRKHTLALRYKDFLATRSPPQPVLPDGPNHKLSDNFYCSHDGRREAQPPEIIAASRSRIEDGAPEVRRITPGKIHQWD